METPEAEASRRRLRRSVGATMVEYVLVFSVFAAGGIGVARYLTTGARSQVTNQADCVSTRPPPASCQVPAVQTTTSTVVVSTTATIPPSSTSSTASTTAPPPGTVAWDNTFGTWNTGTNVVTWRMTVQTAASNPVPGATVTFKITVNPGNQVFYDTCTSDAAGLCSKSWNVPFTNATSIKVEAVNVASPTPVTLPTTFKTYP